MSFTIYTKSKHFALGDLSPTLFFKMKSKKAIEMSGKTRFIGLLITLILAIIWIIFVGIWFFSPKKTCVTETNSIEEICFDTIKEAHEYMDKRALEIKKERGLIEPKYFFNNSNHTLNIDNFRKIYK